MTSSQITGGRAFILLAPALILFILFTIVPIVYVINMSMFKTNMITTTFVGIGNYVKAFRDKSFVQHFVNTWLYTGFLTIGWTILPLGIALLAYDMHRVVQSYVRFIFYVPTFASGVIISTIWLYILHPTNGLANWIMTSIGLQPQMWLGERLLAIGSLSFILITSYLGFYILIYMSAILAIDKNVLESARMDGASEWQIKTRIIIPIISPTIFFISLLTMIAALQMWETIFVMSPTVKSYNLMFNIFDSAFQAGKYGFASAKTLILIVMVFSISFTKRLIEKRVDR